ncbi:radical SAM family heme chaperone HemW [Muricauda sp. CAU 1633]|uniref:radical SAM family heme chaperone HemW n=1 Tax=Allomuricauda sp. CAU 1633 TaxID=2816036 RepID=UPI001A8CDF32|nr:radical SAM family heme chaperone HemW [Muricauda sp. CAU 1633]MBO0324317.1 radical SAM family heme chaperone HemW [Muricauda sp. CAU 1633]
MSGVYIHVPFCKQACHYCDFHFSTQLGKKETMVDALVKEMELRKDELPNELVETIYFGGGTPSVLSNEEIERLIQTVYDHYNVIDMPEITLEANPDDLSSNRIVQLSNSLINRLSIGIQSFFEEDLQLMNRAHNAEEAENCIREATKHFDNISIDLIYGIPGMSNDRWKTNIQKTVDFGLPHISSYALTVEPKTALKKFIEKGIVPDVDDEQAQEQFYILVDLLEANGFINYEISNFGKPGFFSRNNTSYWLGKTYLGIGPSAHSFDGQNRSWNIRNNVKYIKSIGAGELPNETETLTQTDRYNEYVMTGLRTIWGVSLERITADFGPKYVEYLTQQSHKFLEQGLLVLENDTLLTTKKGKFLADGIASDLFFLR